MRVCGGARLSRRGGHAPRARDSWGRGLERRGRDPRRAGRIPRRPVEPRDVRRSARPLPCLGGSAPRVDRCGHRVPEERSRPRRDGRREHARTEGRGAVAPRRRPRRRPAQRGGHRSHRAGGDARGARRGALPGRRAGRPAGPRSRPRGAHGADRGDGADRHDCSRPLARARRVLRSATRRRTGRSGRRRPRGGELVVARRRVAEGDPSRHARSRSDGAARRAPRAHADDRLWPRWLRRASWRRPCPLRLDPRARRVPAGRHGRRGELDPRAIHRARTAARDRRVLRRVGELQAADER